MIYLIWSIINLAVLFFFFYLITGFIRKGKSFFNPQLKVVSILVMVVGIFQLLSATGLEENSNQIEITQDYDNNNPSKIEELVLEDHLTFDINLLVKYSIDQNDFIPTESNSFLTGFISGYEWEYTLIQTNSYTSNQKAEFEAKGILKWKLFGVNLYNETKTFSGTLN
ncbi:hypothetical protein [Lewinella cohaerens]|uniref:hypothetical protein n=1 Tax=Lewinella cohaerens TaxID=70995 RepID=UPI0003818C78|nr:hypothetical protein [Lewinella cohaerens]